MSAASARERGSSSSSASALTAKHLRRVDDAYCGQPPLSGWRLKVQNMYDAYPPMATLPTIFVLSVFLTAVALPPENSDEDDDGNLDGPWRYVSAFFGYAYFLSWSLSFYPQIIQNQIRRSTIGLSPDYCLYNVIGFSCYTVYNVSLYTSSAIQSAYKSHHDGNSSKVALSDVLFAVHAILLSSVSLAQMQSFDGMIGRHSRQTPSRMCLVLSSCMVMFILVYLFMILAYGGNVDAVEDGTWKDSWLNYFDYIYALSWLKMGISIIKYTPQMYSNYRRKSTTGWNIWGIILDFSGGSLSLAQLLGDCSNTHDWSGLSGDPVKLGLSVVSMLYDCIFLFQHYVLYGANDAASDLESSSLLGSDSPRSSPSTSSASSRRSSANNVLQQPLLAGSGPCAAGWKGVGELGTPPAAATASGKGALQQQQQSHQQQRLQHHAPAFLESPPLPGPPADEREDTEKLLSGYGFQSAHLRTNL